MEYSAICALQFVIAILNSKLVCVPQIFRGLAEYCTASQLSIVDNARPAEQGSALSIACCCGQVAMHFNMDAARSTQVPCMLPHPLGQALLPKFVGCSITVYGKEVLAASALTCACTRVGMLYRTKIVCT